MENQENNGRRKELELARDRGEYIAQIQLKRDTLEKDRQTIMEDLERVKNGDISGLRKNEASRWDANEVLQKIDMSRVRLDPAIKDKLISDEVRIKSLREQRDKTLRDVIPESDLFDEFTRSFN